jgi:hypothetical protein
VLESITDPVIPRARGAYRFANVATPPVSPRRPELTMHELVQDLDGSCDDVCNDVVCDVAVWLPEALVLA